LRNLCQNFFLSGEIWGSHRSVADGLGCLGCDIVLFNEWFLIWQMNVSWYGKSMYLLWLSVKKKANLTNHSYNPCWSSLFQFRWCAIALLSSIPENHNLSTDILLCPLKVTVFSYIPVDIVPMYFPLLVMSGILLGTVDPWRWRHSVVQNAKNWLPSDTLLYPRWTTSTIQMWKPQNLQTIHKSNLGLKIYKDALCSFCIS
jgi:hypothetical protein